MKKKSKKIVAITLSVVLGVGAIGGGLFAWNRYGRKGSPVEVDSVQNFSTSYGGDETSSYGMATSEYVQELYPETDKTIQEIAVTEGQEVKKGDVLLRYDTTKQQLELESCQLDAQQTDYEIQKSQQEIARLQAMTPYVPLPEPQPVEPDPIPDSTATLCDSIDAFALSAYFAGDGSSANPYRYLCSSSCQISLNSLLQVVQQKKEDTAADSTEDSIEETETKAQNSTIASNANYRFEVHEGDNENARMLYGWELTEDGSLMFLPEEFDDSDDSDIVIPETPVIPGNPDLLTREDIAQQIQSEQENLKTQQYHQKEAALALEAAQKELENATVTSKIDGVVKTLKDVDEVLGTSNPFLVVSGEKGFYVQGTINEGNLDQIQVGSHITASNWEDGSTYDAEIIEISDYPEDDNGYYYDGNPNTSNYAFTALISEPGDLKNGTYLDLTLATMDSEAEDALFLYNPYIRSDDSGKYVYKVGSDGKLMKQIVTTGRTMYGEYTEILSGLTRDDYIAFPYGKNVKDGATVKYPDYYDGDANGGIDDGMINDGGIDDGMLEGGDDGAIDGDFEEIDGDSSESAEKIGTNGLEEEIPSTETE